MLVPVFLGLGANLGDRGATLHAAIERLGMALGAVAVSPWYESDPVGDTDQPEFLNLVAGARTRLPPQRILALALGIERALGRVRDADQRYGPRTIDIDLLIWNDVQLAAPDLTLPHPRMTERAFVLAPLSDLNPDMVIAGTGKTVAAHYAALTPRDRAGTRRLAQPVALAVSATRRAVRAGGVPAVGPAV